MQHAVPESAPQARERIFCAIDTSDLVDAVELARKVKGLVGGIKLGKAFFTANGLQGLHALAVTEMPVFLDLKFHDIPNTVGRAVAAAVGLGPAMITVHAAGGPAMMQAAAEAASAAARRKDVPRPRIVAVTVLTSLGPEDLAQLGVEDSLEDHVLRLATLAREAGLDGAVCSPHEVEMLRAACGPDFKLVVPGVRPAWAAEQDQKRVTTPAEALARGADYLVIGRPISEAADPAEAARRIADEVEAG